MNVLITLYAALVLAIVITRAASVTVPSSTPNGAIKVDPSFANLALEFPLLVQWTQTSRTDSSTNQYTVNLLNNIFGRTGGHPIIRVGGLAGLTDPVSPYPTPGSHAPFKVQYGPSFWPLTKKLSSTGAKWSPQLPLPLTNQTEINWAAQAMVDGVGLSNIDSIELGNEPNGYGGQFNALTSQAYTDLIKSYIANISSIIATSRRIYQVGEGYSTDKIQIPEIFDDGIDNQNNIKYASQHYYRVGAAGTLVDALSHTRLVKSMAAYLPYISYLKNFKSGAVDFILSEANVLTNKQNDTIADSAGSSVSRADIFLYGMTIGIDRIHFESGLSGAESVFLPQDFPDEPAETKASYYAYLPISDFIGTGGNTMVSQVSVDGQMDGNNLVAYGAFVSGKPVRLALVNTNVWGGKAPAPFTTFTLSGLPSTVSSVTVRLLKGNAGSGGDPSTITYANSQWTYASQGTEVTGVQIGGSFTAAVSNGVANINVPYTSVAVVFIQ